MAANRPLLLLVDDDDVFRTRLARATGGEATLKRPSKGRFGKQPD